MPQTSAIATHADRGTSWMLPRAEKIKVLLYASNSSNGVDVYDYNNGKQVGQLTAFDGPLGECVDAQGDVYITNSDSGTTVEYAHGGSAPLKTFTTTNGYADGCSVNSHGDLAVTDYYTKSGPGQVCIWKRGKGAATCYHEASFGDSDKCYYMSPAGYDDKGNLFVEGEDVNRLSTLVCALLKHSTTHPSKMVTLSFNVAINSPSSTMWDGKYITLSDEDANRDFEVGIYQATLSGSTLTEVGETVLSQSYYNSTVQQFVVGEKNTPVNRQQGETVVGGAAAYSSSSFISFWHYPDGGNSYKYIGTPGFVATGVSVSIAP